MGQGWHRVPGACTEQAEGSCVLLHLCSPGVWGLPQLSPGTGSAGEQDSPLGCVWSGDQGSSVFPEGAGLSCRELSLLRDWQLLLHREVGIEQLKGQAANLAYFCVLSHRV